MHSRQSAVSKLQAARAAIEKQTDSKADASHEDAELPASPAGSSDSPRASHRKTTGKTKSALVQKRTSPSET